MQEEIENRTVNLAISTSKLTANMILVAGKYFVETYKCKSEIITGKQTLKELLGQNQGVTNIDISRTDLKGFERFARKYGVDYAVTKDKSVTPTKFLVFFKAKDADAMNACFNAYSADVLNRNKKPSVRKMLQKMKDKAPTVKKTLHKEKLHTR